MTVNCKGCGLPIVPLQDPRYTGREPDEHWHYSCWEKGRPEPTNMRTLAAQFATTSEKLRRSLNDLRGVLGDRPATRKPVKQHVEYDE